MKSTKLLFFMAIVSSALRFYGWADQIFPADLVGTFSRSNHERKYDIEFHPEDGHFHPDDNQDSVVMLDKNGRKFLCFLPKEEKAKRGMSSFQQNISSVIMETEKRTLKTPDELLELLSDKCLLRQKGWWSYEFCHQKRLRQLHIEDDINIVQQFVLGVYDAEATAAFNQILSDTSTLKDPHSKDASVRYHSHIYRNGTICDLTDQPREAEVRFVCADTRATFTSIAEISTCKYALTVQCPTLCKHPLFQQGRPVWHTIHCNPLPKEDTATKSEEERFEDNHITMVMDSENPSNFDLEE